MDLGPFSAGKVLMNFVKIAVPMALVAQLAAPGLYFDKKTTREPIYCKFVQFISLIFRT
jgi:hypothetical protein